VEERIGKGERGGRGEREKMEEERGVNNSTKGWVVGGEAPSVAA
jgi:hypothetical protein